MRFRIRFFILIVVGMTGSSRALAALQIFDGFWLTGGLHALKDSSTSTVSYRYENRYVNSLNPPGILKEDTYKVKADDTKALPSIGLLYVNSGSIFIWGYSAAFHFHDTKVLKSEKFDFYRPTNTWDGPRGYQMTTFLAPRTDFRVSLEPGIGLGKGAMVYLRISYHQLYGLVTTETTVDSGLLNPTYTEASSDETFFGVGAGAGLRFQWSDSIFVDLSYDHVSFESKVVPASKIVSPADEIMNTQTQELAPGWSLMGLSLGFRF